jgi:hypothetical protein
VTLGREAPDSNESVRSETSHSKRNILLETYLFVDGAKSFVMIVNFVEHNVIQTSCLLCVYDDQDRREYRNGVSDMHLSGE